MIAEHYSMFGASSGRAAPRNRRKISTAAGFTAVIPRAIYIVSLCIIQEHLIAKNKFDALVHPVLVLLTPFTGQVVLFTGLLTCGLVVRHLD